METNKTKQTYEVPDVKVVSFQVEKGFAGSGSIPQRTNVLPSSETETVKGGSWGTAEEEATGWFN